ncbi:hypothetical protein [Patulibacter sp.]|uniref:hypothetical protein n=1 Tax=Patulibacter sp. TaxID=1912859 RepID=UPI002728ACBA|nr:hypothetical protein [Patulibacter sp.]MDO9408336.1 hypothetical protein [Patulibacter sp.]
MSDPDRIVGVPEGEGPARTDGAAPTGAAQHAGVPDGDGLPQDPSSGGPVSRWRRSYGASPLHLLLHLAAIALIAWALSQAFDSRYEAAYVNLAIWLVGGAVLNDFVALPLYVGLDRLARGAWSLVAGDAQARAARRPAEGRTRRLPALPGNGHVRFPLVMSGVLLLVYFPNITHKAPIGHRLSTGLQEQPDFAGRWLAITAGLLIGSAVLYGLRVLLHARRERRDAPAASA